MADQVDWTPVRNGLMKVKAQGRYKEFYDWILMQQDSEGQPLYDLRFAADSMMALAEWEGNFKKV
jgi:hypothetical protein